MNDRSDCPDGGAARDNGIESIGNLARGHGSGILVHKVWQNIFFEDPDHLPWNFAIRFT